MVYYNTYQAATTSILLIEYKRHKVIHTFPLKRSPAAGLLCFAIDNNGNTPILYKYAYRLCFDD